MQEVMPSAKASVIKRLMALANKLDDEGRTEEADAVDKVLRTTRRRA